ncbi:phosphoribosyltransferase-like protein [Mycobacteroides abscessus]|uniref:phosphoribosyltransferase-like protein n=1 Tax=Mycobacteroides abscessus TaxID=36809 RepID=UPI0005E4A16B|nr:hypothetical protein [Mycobacteroides abscessus]MBN7381192.1 hypothetical protein [Mycobacteroides abscessus subsp. massiliense]CPZ33666.1 Uncharacterised protein [Mycobacteroides abscessus]SHO94052.1 Uncharacterised protein [Mycobacteroides abscessus subsp. abscessus]SHR29062.1 Uncharacterised protein [Mycobacteroides abscessus subsp. abscessus]SHR64898.1 Uncharacterised protein [Mycobacteroides abscessus subsp. abscessus]
MPTHSEDSFWRSLYQREVVDEEVVVGLHRLELLEEFTAYRPTPYFARVEQSVQQLPERFRDAALAIFANVTYLHADLLNSTHRFHWHAVKEQASILGHPIPSSFEDILLLEVDPCGLSPKFAQENLLSGRLNPDRKTRIEEVQDALRALEDATALEDSDRRREARKDLWSMASRAHWIILTDKALSGQSLKGDIDRFIGMRKILSGWNPGVTPHIYICAQVMTSDAHHWVTPDVTLIPDWFDISVIPAIMLDGRMKVNDSESTLFTHKSTKESVDELCEWFDREIIATDRRFDVVRTNSGGDMKYGYRQSGILLADANNTPTNSLPLLWYDSTDIDGGSEHMPAECPSYTGPFPRTHSRIGPEKPRSTSDRWRRLLDPDNESEIISLLGDPDVSV